MFAPPRNAVAFLTSFSVFEGKGNFARSAQNKQVCLRLRDSVPKNPAKGNKFPLETRSRFANYETKCVLKYNSLTKGN